MTTGYRPYTNAAGKLVRPKVFQASAGGYAPGGVSYRPPPPPRRTNPYTGLMGLAPEQQAGYRGLPYTPPAAQQPNTPPPGSGSDPGATTGGGAGGGAGGGGDPYANDPVYQQTVALANANIASARAAAQAARKQVVYELGDPTLALQKGLGLSKIDADLAQANPFSTLKNLLRGHNSSVESIVSSMNKANLSSSSTSNRRQQLEQTGYLGGISNATSAAQKALTTILQNLLGTESNERQRIIDAAAGAYGRAKDDPPVPATGGEAPAPTGSGPNGEWTQADQEALILWKATHRANQPPNPRGPSGGV